MKFKTTAIALAVAGTVALPMAAQADLYASARIGVVNEDTDGVSETQVQGVSSRFGIKSETDLGNGMTAFGKYEWGVDTEGADVLSRRHAYVGLKGDFGSVTLGQTYHTFYNYVVGPNDNPWIGSGNAMVAYVGRTAEAITYAGGSGSVSFGGTVYLKDNATATTGEEGMDGYEVGASFGIGDMTLGVAAKEDKNDNSDLEEPIIGVALTGIGLGDSSIGVGVQVQDQNTSVLVDAGFGNFYAHYEMVDYDKDSPMYNKYVAPDTSPSALTIGYNQSLGRNTLMYYEAVFYDADSNNSDDDSTKIAAVLKYDIE
jgi:predicted porin